MYKVTGVQTCIGITIEPAFDGDVNNEKTKKDLFEVQKE